MNEGSARDFERTADLFVELSGIEYVEDVTQAVLSAFVDAHDLIPKNYRKSEAERDRPIWDIINDAQEDEIETGLSAATINKNITNLPKLLTKARTYGVPMSNTLEPKLLRITEKGSKREKRAAFTVDDIRAIFAHPHLTLDREKDALFWIAHCAAYTGARREEIATLMRRTSTSGTASRSFGSAQTPTVRSRTGSRSG